MYIHNSNGVRSVKLKTPVTPGFGYKKLSLNETHTKRCFKPIFFEAV